MKLATMCLLALFLVSCGEARVTPQQATKKPVPPPESLIAALYKAHAANESPFFQTTSRQRVDMFFQPRLADLIWNDAAASESTLDFDPLYDAQDTDIKDLVIQPAKTEGANAQVTVMFENIGKAQQITYSLARAASGWRISDITYRDGRTLRGILQPST